MSKSISFNTVWTKVNRKLHLEIIRAVPGLMIALESSLCIAALL